MEVVFPLTKRNGQMGIVQVGKETAGSRGLGKENGYNCWVCIKTQEQRDSR